MQCDDRITHRLEHAANLPLTAFAQADEHIAPRLLTDRPAALASMRGVDAARALARPNCARGLLRITAPQKLGTSGKRHAVGERNTTAQPLKRLSIGRPLDQGKVAFLHMAARVEKRVSQLAVGREEKKTRRIAIEAPHGEQPREPIDGDKVSHRSSALGVVHRGDVTGRLVKHDCDVALSKAHRRSAVDANLVAIRIDRAPQLSRLPADRDATGDDEFFGMAARRNTRARKKLLQAHHGYSSSVSNVSSSKSILSTTPKPWDMAWRSIS